MAKRQGETLRNAEKKRLSRRPAQAFIRLDRVNSWLAYAVWEIVCSDPRAACAAASRAIGTRYGEQDT
jgi:hypothetical protein